MVGQLILSLTEKQGDPWDVQSGRGRGEYCSWLALAEVARVQQDAGPGYVSRISAPGRVETAPKPWCGGSCNPAAYRLCDIETSDVCDGWIETAQPFWEKGWDRRSNGLTATTRIWHGDAACKAPSGQRRQRRGSRGVKSQ